MFYRLIQSINPGQSLRKSGHCVESRVKRSSLTQCDCKADSGNAPVAKQRAAAPPHTDLSIKVAADIISVFYGGYLAYVFNQVFDVRAVFAPCRAMDADHAD